MQAKPFVIIYSQGNQVPHRSNELPTSSEGKGYQEPKQVGIFECDKACLKAKRSWVIVSLMIGLSGEVEDEELGSVREKKEELHPDVWLELQALHQ